MERREITTQRNIILLDDGLVICLAGFELMSFQITSEGGYDGVKLATLDYLLLFCHELSANEGVLKLNIPICVGLLFFFCVVSTKNMRYGAPCPSDY